MIKVIGVRFRTAGKIYFFDPVEFDIKKGDHVIVETARGVEYGTVVCNPKEVEEDDVVQPFLYQILQGQKSKSYLLYEILLLLL